MAWKFEGLLDRINLTSKGRAPIGLALGGGGARGFAHIGVLKAFEKFDRIPNVISGVSSGSIAGTLYCAGLTPDDIAQCFREAGNMSSFREFTIPREGIFRLDRFAVLLDSWLPVKRLEECKIPMVVCATDFDEGKSVGWSKGEIVERVVASCSIPIIFCPVNIGGVNYVDGGVLRNLPAWAIRDYVKTLVGSNCSPLNRDYVYKTSLPDIAMRSYQLMAKANTLQDINLCDHVIQSAGLSRFGTFEISSMNRIIDAGYDAACKVLEKIF